MNRLVLINLCAAGLNAAVYLSKGGWMPFGCMVFSSVVACAVWKNQ